MQCEKIVRFLLINRKEPFLFFWYAENIREIKEVFFMNVQRDNRRQIHRRHKKVITAWIFFGICFLFALLGLFVTLSKLEAEQSGMGERAKSGTDMLTEEERNGREPLFLQTDDRWRDKKYGGSIISESGCAPSCLAMVIVALTGNREITPSKVAKYSEKKGYYVEGQGTLWTFISEGSRHYGLQAKELVLSESHMMQVLNEGGKIICAMGPGDFTTEGHFIELYGYGDGGFCVHDPNSLERSRRLWKYSELETQIKNLWGIWRR